MKHFKVITLIFVLTALSSCLVSSLHPFYKAKDKIYDPVMEGAWIDSDSSIWIIEPNLVSTGFMEPRERDGTYKITFYEDEDEISVLTGTLFRLNGVDYVDFVPDINEEHFTSDLISYHHVPVHTLARVQYSRKSILLYWYGDEWLNELFEENRIRIAHETVQNHDYDRQVLTASTDELQKFIKKYANDPKTSEEIQQIFDRGDTDDMGEYGVFLKLEPYDGPLPKAGAIQVEPKYN